MNPIGQCRQLKRRRGATIALVTARESQIDYANPDGIPALSPGLAWCAYPGKPVPQTRQPRRGCVPTGVLCGATPLGLRTFSTRLPRVARASQPWALLRNPFGILPIEPLTSIEALQARPLAEVVL